MDKSNNDTVEEFISADVTQNHEVSPYVFSNRKRVLDIAFSCVLVTFLFILMPLIFVSAMIQKNKKPFFLQERVGLDEKPFKIVKISTFTQNTFAVVNDRMNIEIQNINPVVRFIRHKHIDEIPQALNVLKGDMSVIGPRPYIPMESEANGKVNPLYLNRYLVKPGITGLAQVHYQKENFGEASQTKLALDIKYIKEASLLMDIKIIFKTVRQLFSNS